MQKAVLPTRVRVLILGGGIHGVGLLHDLVSRGIKDVLLIEKRQLGTGTSSASTKLIHGGLRYLKNPRDFSMVFDALHERTLLRDLAPDLVNPLELLLPCYGPPGMPGWMLGLGLFLYDTLAGKSRINKRKKLSLSQASELAPQLNLHGTRSVYSYWDMQTDDLLLVRRVADSAVSAGGQIEEYAEATGIRGTKDGWDVELSLADGRKANISALCVFNALGPWANRFLENSGLKPPVMGVNSKGAHLITRDLGHKAGLFLQSKEDGRMFFLLPWEGKTLIGTTETFFGEDPDKVTCTDADIQYLLRNTNQFLKKPLLKSDIEAVFAGLRWLPQEEGKELGKISREDVIGKSMSQRGLMLTLYGGKLTTYRVMSKKIGNQICQFLGEKGVSRTHLKELWAKPQGTRNPDDFQLRFREQFEKF